MQLPTKVCSTGQPDTEPSPALGLWLVGVRGFLALRMICCFQWCRIQGPWGTGPRLKTQGLKIFLFLWDFPFYCTKVSIKTDLENHKNRAVFYDLTQLLWTFGVLHKDTTVWGIPLAMLCQNFSLSLSWEPVSSPWLSRAPSSQTCQFACLVYGVFQHEALGLLQPWQFGRCIDVSFRRLWSGQSSLTRVSLSLELFAQL